jgi:formylglycine-generating enzyme required for sulfatase activity
MILIPAGSFQMGDSFGDGNSNERPVHTVFVSAFYMDEYEVMKAL